MDSDIGKLFLQMLSKQLEINATVRSELDAVIETLDASDPAFQRAFEMRRKKISERYSKQPASQISQLIQKALSEIR